MTPPLTDARLLAIRFWADDKDTPEAIRELLAEVDRLRIAQTIIEAELTKRAVEYYEALEAERLLRHGDVALLRESFAKELAERDRRLLNVAIGCHDYGGGHHGDGHMDAYQHGIQTVINALTKALKNNPNDYQTNMLEGIGAFEQVRGCRFPQHA
jgi:hypothetical protein